MPIDGIIHTKGTAMKRRFVLVGLVLTALVLLCAMTACAKIRNEKELISISVSGVDKDLIAGKFDDEGAQLVLHYTDGETDVQPLTEAMFPAQYRQLLHEAGTHEVEVLYRGKSTVFTVTVRVEYTVTFINQSGQTIKTQVVLNGDDATPPTTQQMQVAGYRFLGDYAQNYKAVQADITVCGNYIRTWIVDFFDGNNQLIVRRIVDDGAAAQAPTETERQMEGYTFAAWDVDFDRIEKDTNVYGIYYAIATPTIKNIIYLIPDGAGFGTYDLANALKKTYGTGVKDQATPITTDAIAGRTVQGLYLDEFMVGSAGTAMANAYGNATDSAAAGTALLCGVKTNYVMVGLNPDCEPVANLLELARLEGKATGFVTTKCLVDATPSDGLAHSLKRADQDNSAYQKSVSQQILYSGADVVLCYGSDGGYYAKANTQQAPLHDDRAANHGYTVVSDLSELREAVANGATKLFSNFQIDYQALNATGEYQLTNSNYYLSSCAYNTDYQALHLLYDCDAKAGVDLTLMDLAKAALNTLYANIADEDGFCLVIEGGAIDNAAEGRNVREAVAEYLAFDEVFGYCVNWAMQRNDTIVVACPDHDSGGIYMPTLDNGNYTLETLLQGLYEGTIAHNTRLAGAVSGHSPQNVPVWLYAPDWVRGDLLTALGLPQDAATDKVRTGLCYDGTVINDEYAIQNCDIAPAIVQAADLMTFGEATATLFADAGAWGTYDVSTEVFTFTGGERVKRNTDYWTDANEQRHTFDYGVAIYPTNEAKYTTYDDTHTVYTEPNTVGGVFYVPQCALQAMGYMQ